MIKQFYFKYMSFFYTQFKCKVYSLNVNQVLFDS